MNTAYINNTSSETVKKATGKGWEEWIRLLDDLGAETMSHKQIAQMLFDKGYIENGWWCQKVVVGWEKFHGRELGATSKGYQVAVQGTLPLNQQEVWLHLVSKEWLQVWLGVLSTEFSLEKSASFETTSGISGEVRTFKPEQYIRLAYMPKQHNQSTTLIVSLQPKAKGTVINFTQEKLVTSQERAVMKTHWEDVIKKLKALVV